MVKTYRKCFLLFLAIFLVFTSFAGAYAQGSDIANHWAKDVLEEWLDAGLIKGYADGSFKPDKQITRAEFIALTNRALGFEETGQVEFKDVPTDAWYRDTLSIALIQGYIGGYADGTIRPQAPISRQEVATMLIRLTDLESDATAANHFTDAIPTWSKGNIGAVVAAGFMNGYPNGTFAAEKPITRAEAVVTLNRLLAYVNSLEQDLFVVDEAGVYGPEHGTELIEGDVIIEAAGVTLQNLIITGDLLIAESVGEGDVFLQGVEVQGETYIAGGGENSIHVEDTILVNIIVDKKTGTVRIVATGNSYIASAILQSSAKLEESNLTGVGFADIMLAASLPANAQVTLLGNFDSVDIQAASIAVHIPRGSVQMLTIAEGATDTSLNLGAEARVLEAIIDAVVSMLGQGTIDLAKVNISGVTFTKAPDKMVVKPGVNPPQTGSIPSTGGGGGGGGGSSDSDTPPPKSTEFTLSSSAEKSNGELHIKYAFSEIEYFADRGAKNLSVPLNWSNTPQGTEAFALVMYDSDADNMIHWAVLNIPGKVTSLTEGASAMSLTSIAEMPQGSLEILGYEGPYPLPGIPHHYHFELIALPAALDNAEIAEFKELVQKSPMVFSFDSSVTSAVYDPDDDEDIYYGFYTEDVADWLKGKSIKRSKITETFTSPGVPYWYECNAVPGQQIYSTMLSNCTVNEGNEIFYQIKKDDFSIEIDWPQLGDVVTNEAKKYENGTDITNVLENEVLFVYEVRNGKIVRFTPLWLGEDSIKQPAKITVTSPAFANWGDIQTVHANVYGGSNTSIPLNWSGAPEETSSFAVIMYEEYGEFINWALFNISNNETFLGEGASPTSLPTDSTEVYSYSGPSYSSWYHIEVLALNTSTFDNEMINAFKDKANFLYHDDVQQWLRNKIIGVGTLSGYFLKPED